MTVGENVEWTLGFLFGTAFIVFYAAAHFAQPHADPSYTTRSRYLIAAAWYVLPQIGILYVLAAFVLWAVTGSGLAQVAPGIADTLETPAWIAVLMILLTRVPQLSDLERRFLQHAHRIAGMPDEAMALRDRIRTAKIHLDEARARELHFTLLRRGLDLGERDSLPDDTLHAQWIQASALGLHLQRWADDPRFAAFTNTHARQLYNLLRRFDYLIFKSSRTVEAIGNLNKIIDDSSDESGSWDSLGSLVERDVYGGENTVLDPVISTTRLMIQNLREELEFFIKDASLLIARIALRHRATEKGRVELLEELGIRLEPVARTNLRVLVLVFGIVLAAMLLTLVVFGTADQTEKTEDVAKRIGIIITVPINFVIAFLCAIYPKQYFAFANHSIFGRAPYLFYFGAGVAAAALSFVVSLAMRTLIYQDATDALYDAGRNSPWLLISFTVASITAVLIQDGAGPRIARYWRRAWDSGAFALSLGASMIVVQLLLQATRPEGHFRLAPIIMGFAIGAILGFFVPARFRISAPPAPARGSSPESVAVVQ